MLKSNSRLFVTQAEGTNEHPRRLLGLVVQKLYLPDDTDFIEMYRKYKYGFAGYFEQCASGAIVPQSNMLQDTLLKLCGQTKHINLYIGMDHPTTPSHYLSMKLNPDTNLFHLVHRKIRRGLTRNGIIAYYPGSIAPMPDLACGILPTLAICGSDRMTFTSGLDYEAKRDLTHCAIFTEADTLATWHNPGRVTVKVLRGTADGYSTPYDFQLHNIRSTPYPNSKTKFIVHANLPPTALDYTPPRPYIILPQFKNSTPYHFDTIGYGIIPEILKYRLTPIIGVTYEDASSFYTLSYNPGTEATDIHEYIYNRANRYCSLLPAMKPLNNHKWLPNYTFLHILKNLVNDPSPDELMRKHRKVQLDRLLYAFSAKDWPSYFASCGLDTSPNL